MMNLLFNVFLLLLSYNPNNLFSIAVPVSAQELIKEVVFESRPTQSIKKWTVRWKKVFRPVYIFKKRAIFWLAIFGSLLLVMSLLGLLAERYNYEWNWTSVNTDGTYLLASAYLISAFVVLLLLLWIPMVWIFRIFQELRWKKRFNRCFGFKKKK